MVVLMHPTCIDYLNNMIGGVLVINSHIHTKESGTAQNLLHHEAGIIDVPSWSNTDIKKGPPTYRTNIHEMLDM